MTTITTKQGEQITGTVVDFTDREGIARRVLVLPQEKHGGYRAVGTACDDLRGPLVKLWMDGHLGRRFCAVTQHYAPLVQRGPSYGRDATDRALAHVAPPVAYDKLPRLCIATGEVYAAAQIIRELKPNTEN